MIFLTSKRKRCFGQEISTTSDFTNLYTLTHTSTLHLHLQWWLSVPLLDGLQALTVSSAKKLSSNKQTNQLKSCTYAPNLNVNAKGTQMNFRHQANLSRQEVNVSQRVPSVSRLLMLLGDSEG